MTPQPATAHPQQRHRHRTRIWWTILIISACVSLYLNIWHALHDGQVKAENLGLALTLGVYPVIIAALLSHTFVVPTPWPVRCVVVLLFLVGMAMSMTAQVEVLTPVAQDKLRAIGFVFTVDVPALVALFMIAWIARMEAARTDAGDEPVQEAEQIRTEPRTDLTRTDPSPRPIRVDPLPRTDSRTLPYVPPRTDADPVRTPVQGPRTDSPVRTEPHTPPRTDAPVRKDRTDSPVRTNPQTRTDNPAENYDHQDIDRDTLIVQLASEIMLQPDTWRPNYTALMERTGRSRSWCEKVVAAARRAAAAETETRTDG